MESRFVPKKLEGATRGSDWRVYDLQNGSFPYRTTELGEVLQDSSQTKITEECGRLTREFGGLKRSARKPRPTRVSEDED